MPVSLPFFASLRHIFYVHLSAPWLLISAAFVSSLDASTSTVHTESWFMAFVKVVFWETRKDDLSTILDTRVCARHGKLFAQLGGGGS
jgi:hypothetical protein